MENPLGRGAIAGLSAVSVELPIHNTFEGMASMQASIRFICQRERATSAFVLF